MTSHEDIRIERIAKLKRTIDEARARGVNIDMNKLIGVSCMEWGVTVNTVKDYLKIIEMTQ